MKQLLLAGFFALGLSGISCSSTKAKVENTTTKEISATGIVSSISNGKDGYMASFKGQDNKNYVATISIVNLNKKGEAYKTYKIGDRISVKGAFWKDSDGTIHITAQELN